jgi:sulfate permease, SulP family
VNERRVPEAGDAASADGADRAYPDKSPFRRSEQRPLLSRTVPVSDALSGYRPNTARRDGIAALTVAALALPSAMAYAEVAGVSPVNGLYALLLPTVAYALLGTSRQLVIGPEGSISALVGASVLGLAAAGSPDAARLAAMLALLVAACFALAWLLRLGWIADYLSRPVLIGYIHGVAAVLVIGQLGKVLGLEIEAMDPVPQLVELARELGDTSATTLAVGAGALLVLLPLRFVAPRFPAPLVAVVGGIALSSLLALADHGVAVVGDIPAGLPSVGLPQAPLANTLELVPVALGLFLVIFADAILTARSYAGKHGQHVEAGQELLAIGGANAAAGLSQGIPVGASGSRTAVSDGVGVRTQLGALMAAGVILVILIFLTGPIGDLPKAVLGATIISAAIGLVNPGEWRALRATDHVELAIAAVTMAGVLVAGVLEAIAFAVGLSIVDVVRRSARPHDAVLGWVERLDRYADVSVHRDARLTPGVVVYRLDDRLFFANASYVKGRVREALRGAPTPARWLVFDAEAMTHVDSAGLTAIGELVRDLRRGGITVVVARMRSATRQRLDESGLSEEIGPERFHSTVRAGVEACERDRRSQPA